MGQAEAKKKRVDSDRSIIMKRPVVIDVTDDGGGFVVVERYSIKWLVHVIGFFVRRLYGKNG